MFQPNKLLTLVALACLPTYAAATGSILGTVLDPTGATIEGVEVTATSVETGVARAFQTAADGNYEIPRLLPGSYRIVARKQGFKTREVRGLVLQVDQRARVDMTLEVGSISESISVEETVPLVSSDSAAVGTVITNKRVVELPLNGRRFLQLTLLTPGAIPATRSSGAGFEFGEAVSVNGARAEHNNFMLDGVDNNVGTVGSQAINPSIDAIQEFKIQASGYSAEFGRAGGAQISVSTRSGTNELHGTLFEFLRNNKLQARNFFDRARPAGYQQNQFGYSLGGPVVIPKLYDGRNRTFFFTNFDATRIRQALPRTGFVPPAAQRSGDFSASATPIIDPLTGQAFPGNRIPTGRIDPIARKVLDQMPLPSSGNPNTAPNYLTTPSIRDDSDQFTVRGDHQISNKDSFFGRYSFAERERFSPGVFSDVGAGRRLDPVRNLALNWTRIFNPRVISEVRFGYNSRRTDNFHQNAGRDFVKELGLPMLSTDSNDFGYPSFSIPPYTTFGDIAIEPRQRLDRVTQAMGNVAWIRGGHTVKLGLEYRYTNLYNAVSQKRRGEYLFTPSIFSGDALGNFLLGFPTTTLISNPPQTTQNIYSQFDTFVQDDWKVTRRLTLNIGVRYVNMEPWKEANNRASSFDPDTGKLVTLGQGSYPRGFFRRNTTDFAPRFGFAFSPLTNNRVVLRGGYGVFFATEVGNPPFDQGQNPPFGGFALQYDANRANPNALTLQNPFPGSGSPNTPQFPQLYAMDLNYKTPYTQQWSLNVQTEFARNWLLEVGYAGNKGTHILATYDSNQPLPGTGGVQSRRPYSEFSVINYSSSQTSV